MLRACQVDADKDPAPTLPPRLLDLLALLGYYASHAPDLLIRLARVLAFTLDYHLRVMSRSSAARKTLARAESQKVGSACCADGVRTGAQHAP